MIWVCLYNVVVVVAFVHLATYFDNVWFVLLALLFTAVYKKSDERKDDMNESDKQGNDG